MRLRLAYAVKKIAFKMKKPPEGGQKEGRLFRLLITRFWRTARIIIRQFRLIFTRLITCVSTL
ncbi:hypothetical protein CRX72_15825 [Pantoea sp. BRM17]|nr:hypothetical protein CRX72_15825 [Pantoea sp. BRM17]